MIAKFKFNETIQDLIYDISSKLIRIENSKKHYPPMKFRFYCKVQSIKASLSLEGNKLTNAQFLDLVEGNEILAVPKDICEAKNALIAYSDLSALNPLEWKELLKINEILMKDLNKTIFIDLLDPTIIASIDNVFNFLNTSEFSWLIKATIFYYEFIGISPFKSRNGIVGRLWLKLLLMKFNSVFEFVYLDVFIKAKQKEYYALLYESQAIKESTLFIEFLMKIILEALVEYEQNPKLRNDSWCRLGLVKPYLQDKWFTRKEYRFYHEDISDPVASKDLLHGLEKKILTSVGENNQVKYRFL